MSKIRLGPEGIHAQNQRRREEALRALDNLMRERLATGTPGSIGIRIPFRRKLFGVIREIREGEREVEID